MHSVTATGMPTKPGHVPGTGTWNLAAGWTTSLEKQTELLHEKPPTSRGTGRATTAADYTVSS